MAGSREQRAELMRQARAAFAARRFDDAAQCCGQIIAANPNDAEALGHMGAALHAGGREAEAAEALARAVTLNPTLAAAHRELAHILEQRGLLPEALERFDAALRIEPADGSTHYNRGVVLLRLARFTDAVVALERALAHGKVSASTFNNLGLACHRLGRLTDAQTHLRRAVAIDGRFVSARINLGNVLWDQQDVPAANAEYARALQIDSGNPKALLNLALGHLLLGDLARGWPLFAARLLPGARESGLHAPRNVPLWDGRTHSDKQIILVTEQGFGDAIQFVRFGGELRALGFDPVLQCHARLCRLLATAKGFSGVAPDGTEYPPERHLWFPLMSLPAVLGTSLGSIPMSVPYLVADPQRVVEWRARMAGDGYRVGIAWQGSPDHEREGLFGRSIPLAAFGDLVGVPGTQWFSLQKGAGSDQLDAVPWRGRISSYGTQLDAGADAFSDTAAIMMNLDLVITSDTSIAHLAGSLGRPVWLALTRMPDWRWLLDRADSPWYPTMRLFRQRVAGEWSRVFDDMRVQLVANLASIRR